MKILVTGHICIDMIPAIKKQTNFAPGSLIDTGKAEFSTGGAVANTGIALHRLGIEVSLCGKIGRDNFGNMIMEILQREGLDEKMLVGEEEITSYSVVLSPPQTDRTFLHCPGANDTFSPDDISDACLEDSNLLHFGYPPLMKNVFRDGGVALASLFGRARENGMAVSLDMARPDPESEAGAVDWKDFLSCVLPQVDIFMPSIDELLFMLQRSLFDRIESGVEFVPDVDLLSGLADEIIGMGCPIVLIKMGAEGLYLKTSENAQAFGNLKSAINCFDSDTWAGREENQACFKVKVAGTTGAGDCTIAGFLAAVVKGMDPLNALRAATGVGACNVEKEDATSGVPSWDGLWARIDHFENICGRFRNKNLQP